MKRVALVAFLSVTSALAFLGVAAPARAQTERVLYSFSSANGDAYLPSAPLVMDSSGNLFGTTDAGGSTACGNAGGCGAVFELVNSNGTYNEKLLHSFTGTNGDGAVPVVAGLIMDSSGNLYGTTVAGGDLTCSPNPTPAGCGTVFELVNSGGTYTEEVLYAFMGANGDGAKPRAPLVMDSQGNLYGTTEFGGDSTACTKGCGTVFELANSSGSYTEKVLYSFKRTGGDGASPRSGLMMDSAGNLFGTTSGGGPSTACGGVSCGTVFELVSSSGTYTEKVLYSFAGVANADGASPDSGLIMDASGNLFGNTPFGGTSNCYDQTSQSGCGTSYELINSSGSYTEKVLHIFTGLTTGDGSQPRGGLVMDSSGNLFGTTSGGLVPAGNCATVGGAGCGTVFELVNSSGNFTEKVLYTFAGYITRDALGPSSGLIFDSSGNLYGTTWLGGEGGVGTVFEVSPSEVAAPDFTLGIASGSPSSVSVASGQSAITSLFLASQGGFNKSVSLACSGAPVGATCTLSPSAVTLNGSAPSLVTVNVTTTARSLAFPRIASPPAGQEIWLLAMTALMLLMLFVVSSLFRRNGDGQWTPAIDGLAAIRFRYALLATILVSAAAVASCGGGTGSGDGGTRPNPGTPAGTYTLTVTGTSGSLSHSTTLTLNVQ